jgi:hypothetical protein
MSAISESHVGGLSRLTNTPVFTTEESTGYAGAVDLLTMIVGLVGIWRSVEIHRHIGRLTVALA